MTELGAYLFACHRINHVSILQVNNGTENLKAVGSWVHHANVTCKACQCDMIDA